MQNFFLAGWVVLGGGLLKEFWIGNKTLAIFLPILPIKYKEVSTTLCLALFGIMRVITDYALKDITAQKFLQG